MLIPKKWFLSIGPSVILSVGLSVSLSVCLSETPLQVELIELETSNSVHEFLVLVGRHNKVFEKIAHAQRVAAIEHFWF